MYYLPENYEGSCETRIIQEAIQAELNALWQGREDLLAQLDPNTATWGLSYWEKAFGLPVIETLPYSTRRSRIIARIRGTGTTTVARLQSVVETFCPGCEVSIVEHYSQYVVEIKLILTDQSVDDMDGLKDQLDRIMPAHLAWGISYTIETRGGIVYGVCSEMAGSIEVWPLRVVSIETTGRIAAAGAQIYHGVIEVFPEGGVSNG